MSKIITDENKINKVIDSFTRTTDGIFSLEEFKRLLFSGRQLRMKFGVDVTASDLHIGHAVNLWMYRELQELGHKMVFLIGDFTTQIGDPSGKSKTRPIISLKEIQKNAEAFIKQAMIALRNDSALVEIRRNSEWYDKISGRELLSLMSMVTHDRLVTRDMFRKRIKEGREIYEHEIVYPILQGYDSVMLKADLTIIGSDQLFNEMMGRFFQEKFGQSPQVIITTKITPGIDGKEKQSKSLDNYIGLMHSPQEKFGRLMSMPDNLIVEYFKVYTKIPLKEIEEMEKSLGAKKLNPRDAKARLAREIVTIYHGKIAASDAEKEFSRVFKEHETPSRVSTFKLKTAKINILDLLVRTKLAPSKSEAKRLIEQKGVKIDKDIVDDWKKEIVIKKGMILQVGKRKFLKLI